MPPMPPPPPSVGSRLAALAAVAAGVSGWGLGVAAVAGGVWGLGGGQASAVAAVTVTRGLWADCATDTSGVTSCVPLVSLVTLPGYLQGSRALAVVAAVLGALGLGLGGFAGPRRVLRAAGGALMVLGGGGWVGSALWFGVCSTREFFDPQTAGVRFEPGPGVLMAGGGGALLAAGGGALLCMARPSPSRPRRAATPPPTLGDKYGRNEYV